MWRLPGLCGRGNKGGKGKHRQADKGRDLYGKIHNVAYAHGVYRVAKGPVVVMKSGAQPGEKRGERGEGAEGRAPRGAPGGHKGVRQATSTAKAQC
ncbi:hypothetical protein JCM16814_22000 [Desulfobaculum senezii]